MRMRNQEKLRDIYLKVFGVALKALTVWGIITAVQTGYNAYTVVETVQLPVVLLENYTQSVIRLPLPLRGSRGMTKLIIDTCPPKRQAVCDEGHRYQRIDISSNDPTVQNLRQEMASGKEGANTIELEKRADGTWVIPSGE
ncbi:MAG: hypothetical protein UX60_C0009G0014 [Berkelbacteria bacterium GW2011_GWA2_46_7]|uniref:Uncharacterized protein n=1 Tax=Berkelbacteria bacterium GW2011_GWA2_46_7 TaxID=1618335 RepID=A0A0G1QH25_9BACT|nr:MAG: hypothetical protein UX60_C0009G0014 [Berkelbacteria bacterium GW2011_GWA2_46_7]